MSKVIGAVVLGLLFVWMMKSMSEQNDEMVRSLSGGVFVPGARL